MGSQSPRSTLNSQPSTLDPLLCPPRDLSTFQDGLSGLAYHLPEGRENLEAAAWLLAKLAAMALCQTRSLPPFASLLRTEAAAKEAINAMIGVAEARERKGHGGAETRRLGENASGRVLRWPAGKMQIYQLLSGDAYFAAESECGQWRITVADRKMITLVSRDADGAWQEADQFHTLSDAIDAAEQLAQAEVEDKCAANS